MEPEKPLKNVREKREEDSLGAVLGLDEVPSLSAIGDWLRATGGRHRVEGIVRANDGITSSTKSRSTFLGSQESFPRFSQGQGVVDQGIAPWDLGHPGCEGIQILSFLNGALVPHPFFS